MILTVLFYHFKAMAVWESCLFSQGLFIPIRAVVRAAFNIFKERRYVYTASPVNGEIIVQNCYFTQAAVIVQIRNLLHYF
jgi:hypothetical protein